MSRDEPRPAQAPAPRPRAATVLESVEEIRAQIARQPQGAGTLRPAGPPPVGAGEPDDARPFRPSARPPMALLTVLDDGEDSGEVVRVRRSPFVIGRVEGDLIIPHDAGISGRHAAILRTEEARCRWTLRDLESTNGTFARASSGVLRHGQEFLIGSRRLRFDANASGAAATATVDEGPDRLATRKWQSLAPAGPAPGAALVELTPDGEGPRHPLGAVEAWIGRDPRSCAIVLDDPMVSPRHARLARNDQGQWVIANARSQNGLWMRISEIALDRGGSFQCGEQRFLIKIL